MSFFSNGAEDETPWPSLAQPVLTDGNRWTSAHFDSLCSEDRSAVADGFWQAADLLASQWLADDLRRPYSRIAAATALPLLFLYRHALESAMKAMLAEYSGKTEAEISAYKHDLLKLWKQCRALLWPFGDEAGEDLLAVEKAIQSFHDLDPRNEAFRYSYDLKGNPITLSRVSVDILELQLGMRGVENFFDCADSQLHLERYGF